MDEYFEILHEYVALLHRAPGERVPSPIERARWFALSRLIPGTGVPPGPVGEDGDDGLAVQITAPGGFESARLQAISRDGFRLSLSHPLPVGAHTIVRVITPCTGLEYTFPCRVAWVEGERIGLGFDGAPHRAPLGKALRGSWCRPLDLRTGWGERTRVASA